MKRKKNLKKEWKANDKNTIESSEYFETADQTPGDVSETSRLKLLLRKAIMKDYPPKRLRESILTVIRK